MSRRWWSDAVVFSDTRSFTWRLSRHAQSLKVREWNCFVDGLGQVSGISESLANGKAIWKTMRFYTVMYCEGQLDQFGDFTAGLKLTNSELWSSNFCTYKQLVVHKQNANKTRRTTSFLEANKRPWHRIDLASPTNWYQSFGSDFVVTSMRVAL